MRLVGTLTLLTPSVDVVRLAIEGGKALAALASASPSISTSASAAAAVLIEVLYQSQYKLQGSSSITL